tara:strand:+ start:1278 stop:1574 length:297 start_codon:yes stop_codon:yes gene_type:complete
MKGFPYKSGFKHTNPGGKHEDHHEGQKGESDDQNTEVSGNKNQSRIDEINENLRYIRGVYHDPNVDEKIRKGHATELQSLKEELAALGGKDTSIEKFK